MKKIVYSLMLVVMIVSFVDCEKDNEPIRTKSSIEIKAYPDTGYKIAFSVTAYAASKIMVDWGDGTIEEFDNLKHLEHKYSSQEVQTIVITAETLTTLSVYDGNFEALRLKNCVDLKYLGCVRLNLKEIDITEAEQLLELNCNQNQLTTETLNSIFESLPIMEYGFIVIRGNPGTNDADRQIAIERGWNVRNW